MRFSPPLPRVRKDRNVAAGQWFKQGYLKRFNSTTVGVYSRWKTIVKQK
jgi:hypothetical protein